MLSWIHADFVGGIPGRSADDLISRLKAAISGKDGTSGGSVDLSKCFDRVRLEAVLPIAKSLGMPEKLARIIEKFYQDRTVRFFEQKVGARERCKPAAGLLQGCPFSVMLLNIQMHLWA